VATVDSWIGDIEGRAHVRFGSKADMCAAKRHVRFAPNSDRKSRHLPKVMSALPLKDGVIGRAFFVDS
jgi:hypothetical protein